MITDEVFSLFLFFWYIYDTWMDFDFVIETCLENGQPSLNNDLS